MKWLHGYLGRVKELNKSLNLVIKSINFARHSTLLSYKLIPIWIYNGQPFNKDILWPMNDKESFLVVQKCNYSSSILGVERRDLLQHFDF